MDFVNLVLGGLGILAFLFIAWYAYRVMDRDDTIFVREVK